MQFNKRSKIHAGNLKKPLPEALSQAVAECMYGGPLQLCQTLQGAPMRGCSPQFMRVLATHLHEEFFRPSELLLQVTTTSTTT